MDCIFCKIANKEIPAKIFYENDAVISVLDINPVAPGHTMVIPKTHREKLSDFELKELEPFFAGVKRTATLIEQALLPDGLTMGINQGQSAGQVILHFHFHIIPRYADDGGGSIHSVVRNPSKKSIDEIYDKLKKAS